MPTTAATGEGQRIDIWRCAVASAGDAGWRVALVDGALCGATKCRTPVLVVVHSSSDNSGIHLRGLGMRRGRPGGAHGYDRDWAPQVVARVGWGATIGAAAAAAGVWPRAVYRLAAIDPDYREALDAARARQSAAVESGRVRDLIVVGGGGAIAGVLCWASRRRAWFWLPWHRLEVDHMASGFRWSELLRVGSGDAIDWGRIEGLEHGR